MDVKENQTNPTPSDDDDDDDDDRALLYYLEMRKTNLTPSDDDCTFLYYLEMRITLKGVNQLLKKRLLKTFTTIDFSSNKFSGSIPNSMGNLNSLRYLNLSHNNLMGHIPASLGNISVLESLDLSSNKLDGGIPSDLTRLTFLEKLNLSMNDLVGQIPQSNQFSTFENDSYIGNLRLCGVPLTRKCNEENGRQMQPEEEEEDEYGLIDGFGWRSVVMGYGNGLIVGIGIGCCIIRFGRPRWLVEFFFGVGYTYKKNKKKKKTRKRATPTQRRS
ncbi:receptor-like protein 43 [Salvia miltiorrhiza]|uniref:receptor-like protein 43 n=1 Tax=Salvia miltiorrhiza TaxID=226208 RepID=UPI0025AB6A57|nr:receptor-like protein 43 [Salvia miltiorrhiza]